MHFISSIISWLCVSLWFFVQFLILDYQPLEDYLITTIVPLPIIFCSFLSISILDRFIKVPHDNTLRHFAKFILIGAIGPVLLMLAVDAKEVYFTGPGINWVFQVQGFVLGAFNGLLCGYVAQGKDGVEEQASVSLRRLKWTGGLAVVPLILVSVYYFEWQNYGPGTCFQRSEKDDVWIVIDHRMGKYTLRKWLGGAHNFRRFVPDEPYWDKPYAMQRGYVERIDPGYGAVECPKPLPGRA